MIRFEIFKSVLLKFTCKTQFTRVKIINIPVDIKIFTILNLKYIPLYKLNCCHCEENVACMSVRSQSLDLIKSHIKRLVPHRRHSGETARWAFQAEHIFDLGLFIEGPHSQPPGNLNGSVRRC
jgi:hypothetical protein